MVVLAVLDGLFELLVPYEGKPVEWRVLWDSERVLWDLVGGEG